MTVPSPAVDAALFLLLINSSHSSPTPDFRFPVTRKLKQLIGHGHMHLYVLLLFLIKLNRIIIFLIIFLSAFFVSVLKGQFTSVQTSTSNLKQLEVESLRLKI